VHVIVPTPWVPPMLPVRALARFRDVPRATERRGNVTIHYPRVLGSIEYHTHTLDARLARNAVMECARALHATQPFDLLHAHFIYPDGVIGADIGRTLGIPVMTSEHAFWTPWLVDKPQQRTQVDAALPDIQRITCVSEFLREDVAKMVAGRVPTSVLPNVVDDVTFTTGAEARDPDELLYVGLVRGFKRLDVLLKGFAEALTARPSLKLRILSANAFRAYGANRRQMHDLITGQGIGHAVTVVNGASPLEVASAMRQCAFVTVSSTRRETFCSVAAEALACGTPLIITRCGGPEEFVTADDGVMVEADNPSAFAAGILQGMATRDRFVSADMRARIVGRFGRAAWRTQAMRLYRELVAAGRGGTRGPE
jgi:glycosyltransferase involved in cell wall biosynthesis